MTAAPGWAARTSPLRRACGGLRDSAAHEFKGLFESLYRTGMAPETGFARVDLQRNEAIIAVAGEQAKERRKGKSAFTGKPVGEGFAIAPDNIAEMDVAQGGTNDLVAFEQVFEQVAVVALVVLAAFQADPHLLATGGESLA